MLVVSIYEDVDTFYDEYVCGVHLRFFDIDKALEIVKKMCEQKKFVTIEIEDLHETHKKSC